MQVTFESDLATTVAGLRRERDELRARLRASAEALAEVVGTIEAHGRAVVREDGRLHRRLQAGLSAAWPDHPLAGGEP